MLSKFNRWVHQRIYHPKDSDEILLVKKIWWVCLTIAIPTTIILALLIWLMNYPVLAILVLSGSGFWLLQLVLFNHLKKHIEWFGLASQLFLILFSFVLAWLMGGILHSGGVIFLGLIGPVYALVFPNRRRAWSVFGLYLFGVAVLALVDGKIEAVYRYSYQDNLILFVVSFAISSIFWFVALYFFAYQRTRTLHDLRKEELKSQNLLLNILPSEIVHTLKESSSHVIADKLQDVTILFADMVKFTETSSRMSPEEIIDFLNRTFSAFDHLTEKYGLEKIKTIGDCYMAVGGAPVPNPEHAHKVVQMALDIQEYAANHGLAFRIGIHSGPVVAGVIGVKKFSYDLWGDTVSLASRLESDAPPGAIFISDATHQLISDRYVCKSEGIRYLKGIGETASWRVIGAIDNTAII